MAIASIVVRHEGTELKVFDETIRTPCTIYVDENLVSEVLTILRGKGITNFSVEGIPYPIPPTLADLTNVFLGPNSGLQEEGSHKLYIANTNTTTPLIYGEFDNELVVINGGLTVTGLVDIGTITMDHADLTNTHNITTDIDHATITNTHNLTTDVDHDAITNYTITKHRVIDDLSVTNYELWSADKINTFVPAQIASAAGVTIAPLDGSFKIPSGNLPDLAITKVTVYANETAMVDDSANNQEGDVGVLDDNGYAYMRNSNSTGTISDWTQLALSGTITSVNGDAGPSVTLTADNISDGATNVMMLSTERTKLTGISDNANNYIHPANHLPTIITQDSTNRFVTDTQITQWTNGTRLIVDSSSPGGSNSATGTASITIGDGQTITSCNYSIIAGGILNTISGGSTYASILGGTGNTINSAADMSTIINGQGAKIDHKRCTTIGSYAKSHSYGTVTQANGKITNDGDAQTSRVLYKGQTTDATQTEINIESAQSVNVNFSKTFGFTIKIIARQTAGSAGDVGDSFFYEYKGIILGDVTTAAFVGTPAEALIAKSAGATNFDTSIDLTGNVLNVYVTGEIDKTINWVATINLYEVA